MLKGHSKHAAKHHPHPHPTCEVKASEKSSTTAATVFSTSCTQKEIQP